MCSFCPLLYNWSFVGVSQTETISGVQYPKDVYAQFGKLSKLLPEQLGTVLLNSYEVTPSSRWRY